MPAGPVEPLHDRLQVRAPPNGAIGMSLRGRAIGGLFLSKRSRGGRRSPLRDGFAEVGPSNAAQQGYGIAAACDLDGGAELQPGSGESGSGAIVSGPSAGDCVSCGAVAMLSMAGAIFVATTTAPFRSARRCAYDPSGSIFKRASRQARPLSCEARPAAVSANRGFEEAAASRIEGAPLEWPEATRDVASKKDGDIVEFLRARLLLGVAVSRPVENVAGGRH